MHAKAMGVVARLVPPAGPRARPGRAAGFARAGAKTTVAFTLAHEQLGFYGRDMRFVVEPGLFKIAAGTDSTGSLGSELEVVK